MSLATLQRKVNDLPTARREFVEGSLLRIGEAVLARSSEVSALPGPRRSAIIRGLQQVVLTLLRQDPEQLQRLSDFLRDTPRTPESNGDADERQDLEAQNFLRILAMAKRVENQSLAARELPVSRQRLNQLRDEGKLLAVKLPMHREFLYPRWQFGRDGRPLRAIPRLLEVARRAGLDGLDLHLLMTANRVKGERPLVHHLRTGDEEDERHVLDIVRAANSALG